MKVSYDFLCLDEFGSPNLSEFRNKSRKEVKNFSERSHFGITGVIIPGALYPQINVSGRRLQEKILGLNNFRPFHYSEILHNSRNFSFLGVNKGKRTSLVDSLNNLLKDTNFKIISNFVDKKRIALNYGNYKADKLISISKIKPNISKTQDPSNINLYEISLKFIISEFYKHLKNKNLRGLIIAEARGEQEDRNMLDTFYQYQKLGAGSLSGTDIRERISDLLIIRKSQNHIGLQLADLVCFPVFDYFVPNHKVRTDHFIKRDLIEPKIKALSLFPYVGDRGQIKTFYIYEQKIKSKTKK